MPLIPSTLQSGFNTISIEGGFPQTSIEAANEWADIINDYASLVVPVSTTSSAAKAAFISIFSAIDSNAQNGEALFISALNAYAVTLGSGMAPAFIAVPPPVPIVLTPIISLGLSGAPASAVSALLSQTIDAWFRTGTATPSGGGSPILWS